MTRFAGTLFAAVVLAAVTARPAPAAPPADGQVVAVSLVPAPGRAEFVISVRGAVTTRDFALEDPHRVVVDVSGATLASDAMAIYDGVARAGVRNVRVRQYTPSVVRVVLELDGARVYTVARDDDAIRVSFGADETFLAWSSGQPAVGGGAEGRSSGEPLEPAPVRATPVRSVQRQEPRITVAWDRADIADVVSGFSALSGRTIILGKGVTGSVSAEIRDKPWSQAFQAILASQG
ncbi:MAG TPA: AMIN domain-containing protein, partial [Gemmatimonadales bacterium]